MSVLQFGWIKNLLVSWRTKKKMRRRRPFNLVWTKSEAIKTLQTKLADAKKSIAKLKAEVQTLHQCTADEPQQQQPQQKDATCVSTHSLVTIHSRYQRVLQIHKDNNCSLVNAFRPGGCSPQHPLRFHCYCQIKNHWWMRTQPGIERHGWGVC